MDFERATHDDYLQIIRDLPEFWASSGPGWRTLEVHHPYLVHEFGDTAFVLREDGRVIAYLFGFISQTEPAGYIHLAAVRVSHQGRGIGRALYEHFTEVARERGCTGLKAVTPPFNKDSQAFHETMGFEVADGEPNDEGLPVFRDYRGPGKDVVVMRKRI